MGDPPYSESWPHVGLKFIVEISPGSKVRYPDLVVFPLRVTLVVTPSEYFSMFMQTPSGTFPLSTSLATLDMCVSLWCCLLSLGSMVVVGTSSIPKGIIK